jgi:hypothetical protein
MMRRAWLQTSLLLPDLWQELSVLQRLHYKNNNQHRAAKHQQAVGQVRQKWRPCH